MGYTIRIGNAVPEFSKDYNELWAGWRVNPESSDCAPTFNNDELTGNTNTRSPSYSGWSVFLTEVGLHKLFFEDYEGLMSNHPGCKMITQQHLDEVQTALIKYQARATLPPGFEEFDPDNQEAHTHDGYLARLIWLEWWMRWALANCETPAIDNT